MEINKNIKKFCEQHQIRVLDTNKRASKYHKININFFKDPMDFNRVYEDIVIDSEPLYTVEIAESELERIADFESKVFNHMKKQGHYRIFEMIMEQKEQEKYLTNRYPAVKKAYEHFLLVAELTKD